MTPVAPGNPAKALMDAYDPHLHHNPPPAITELAKAAYNSFQKETLTTCPHLQPDHKTSIHYDTNTNTAFCPNCALKTLIAPLIDKPVHTRKCDTCPDPATTLTTYAIYYGQALITTHTNLCNTCNPNRRTETP